MGSNGLKENFLFYDFHEKNINYPLFMFCVFGIIINKVLILSKQQNYREANEAQFYID